MTDAHEERSQLAWEDALPLAFHAGVQSEDALLVARREADNLRILGTCEALEDRRERGEDPGVAAEAHALEHKVELLIELVSQLVARGVPRPPAVPVRLSALGAAWSPALGSVAAAQAPPATGTVGHLELHLRHGLAEPLRLPARTVAGEEGWPAAVVFDGLSTAELDALERFVFRQHRRKIAGRRRPR